MTATIALIAWILNVGFGLALLTTWLRRGGRAKGKSHIRSLVVFGHMITALAGLGLWTAYLLNGKPPWLAWFTWAFMFVINVLGDAMFIPWLKRRRALTAKLASALPPMSPAELHFRYPIVGTHGILAGITFFSVLLAALGVGT